MNKKLIAIAIATAMTAPVAMADVKISGRVGYHLTSLSDDTVADDVMSIGDKGEARIQFDGTAGDGYARIAYNDTNNAANPGKRDQYVGMKFGGASVQMGRMAGAAKNLEKDAFIATFLQIRGTAAYAATAGSFGSSGFVSHLIQGKFKAGAATITAQYDIGDNAGAASGHEGHTAIAVSGKGGPVNYWASYNNATADGTNGTATNSPSNLKIGAAMKFGKAKVTLNYTSMDKDGVVGANNADTSIAVLGDIGLGNGLAVHAGVAVKSGDVTADDATWMRLAVSKKFNKSTRAYAGYTATANDTANTDTSEIGAGITVKF